jgi:hypothetical protein
MDVTQQNHLKQGACEMSVRQDMRASDRDRQQVVDLLRDGLEAGRLNMDEYVDRMGRAYQATTHGDLAALHADLPVAGARAAAPVVSAPVVSAPAARRCGLAGLPLALRVLWTIWLTLVSINVVVWALVCATTGHLIYPWPLWVAGPYGAILFAVSAAVRSGSRTA